MNLRLCLVLLFTLMSFSIQAQDEEDYELSLQEIMNRGLVDMSIEDWIDLDKQEENKLSFYGFLNLNMERVFNEPGLDENGNTIYESSAFEISTPGFHIYGGSKISEKFTIFFNLGEKDGKVSLVNAWGNWKISELFQIRAGRQYLRFGLFNERLDQLPTYTGIEAPELFDSDHLIVPRGTLLSIHGEKKLPKRATLKYYLSTTNGESGPEIGVMPLGWDIRYKKSWIMFGLSGYMSNIQATKSASSVELGDGSPNGGILPWMASDKYSTFGGFLETRKGGLSVKLAYFNSNHNAVRDAPSVVALAERGLLNQAQIDRMFIEPNSITEDNVNANGNYSVNTWYARFGYDFSTKAGMFTPYFFLDYYENPETIGSKTFGGDNEAGVSDNGRFYKPSLGIVYKPDEKVAVKLDASSHYYKFNGKNESYPEVRLDISYMFK